MNIRLEKTEDYREVENLTREAFWNVYRPGCTEHYVLNQYRTNPDFIPELDFVMVLDGKIIGHVMFSKAEIILDDGTSLPSWTFIPGQMKLLFDRIVYGMMRDTPRFPEPLMKGEKCILLSTCTTPWPWNIWFKQSRGAIRAMREICRYSGFKIVATIERGGTAMHRQLSEKDKQKCHKAIGKI